MGPSLCPARPSGGGSWTAAWGSSANSPQTQSRASSTAGATATRRSGSTTPSPASPLVGAPAHQVGGPISAHWLVWREASDEDRLADRYDTPGPPRPSPACARLANSRRRTAMSRSLRNAASGRTTSRSTASRPRCAATRSSRPTARGLPPTRRRDAASFMIAEPWSVADAVGVHSRRGQSTAVSAVSRTMSETTPPVRSAATRRRAGSRASLRPAPLKFDFSDEVLPETTGA